MDQGFNWADAVCRYFGYLVLENLKALQSRIPEYQWSYGGVTDEAIARLRNDPDSIRNLFKPEHRDVHFQGDVNASQSCIHTIIQ
jgi:hypothetical protein